MAYPTIATPSFAYHRPAGFKDIYVRPSTEKYQTLGAILEGAELKFTQLKANNSMGMNSGRDWIFTAKATMMQSSLTELELLPSLVDGTSAFLFRLSDAGAIPTEAAVTEGWVLLSSTQVGCQAKPILDGNPDNEMGIELTWSGFVLNSEIDAAVKASIAAADFEATGDSDTFKTIGIYSAATDGGLPDLTHRKSCGITSITIADVAGGGAQTLGSIQNFKFSFEPLTSKNESMGRNPQHGFGINLEYEGMETDSVNLLNLNAGAVLQLNLVITMRNGLIWTLSNIVGNCQDYEVTGNPDNLKIVRMMHTGKILLSEFAGIVSTA